MNNLFRIQGSVSQADALQLRNLEKLVRIFIYVGSCRALNKLKPDKP